MELTFQALVVSTVLAYLIARRIHDRLGRLTAATLQIPGRQLRRLSHRG